MTDSSFTNCCNVKESTNMHSNMKIYVPTSISPLGRKIMTVTRQDRVRIVGFRKFEDAQRALRDGPMYHVMADLLSQEIESIRGGEMIVWETTEVTLATDMHEVYVDLCEFVHPHFLDVQETFLAQSSESSENYLDRVFLM